MSGTAKSRQVALELVLHAAATIKGWDLKTGGELISEAELVEHWIRTGSRKPITKGKK